MRRITARRVLPPAKTFAAHQKAVICPTPRFHSSAGLRSQLHGEHFTQLLCLQLAASWGSLHNKELDLDDFRCLQLAAVFGAAAVPLVPLTAAMSSRRPAVKRTLNEGYALPRCRTPRAPRPRAPRPRRPRAGDVPSSGVHDAQLLHLLAFDIRKDTTRTTTRQQVHAVEVCRGARGTPRLRQARLLRDHSSRRRRRRQRRALCGLPASRRAARRSRQSPLRRVPETRSFMM